LFSFYYFSHISSDECGNAGKLEWQHKCVSGFWECGANEAPVWGRKLQDSPSRSSDRIAAMMG